MPFADFIRVREVSSEDNVHLAENLIKSNPGKKWKTKNPGEKSAYVILEMSESQQITGIDIGNEHSAFVTALVGKSTCAPEDFTEILITCSFMTPIESKSSNNTNRVRCFNKDALVPTVSENKWSLVKIICTQPFNKHVPYGLSFIKIHVYDNEKKNFTTAQKNLVPDHFLNKTTPGIGKLKFREDSPDSESENNSSLFSRWKKSKNNIEEQTTAASIRIASKSPVTLASREHYDVQKPQTSGSIKANDIILDRNRDTLLFGDENDDTINKNNKKLKHLSEQIELDKERRRQEKEQELDKSKCKKDVAKSKPSTSKSSDVVENVIKPSCSKTPINNHNISLEAPKKRRSSPPENPVKKHKSSKKFRPFDQLLKGVVLVISGIQNPDRADLRSKAISLGAKYKADWDNTCTHLICAFKNTPKYNQVKGKGKIITRSWIEKCYSSKKYLPWRRYALDSNELSKPESDEEIFDDSQNPENNSVNADASLRKSKDEHEDRNNTLALYDIDDCPKSKPSKFIESSSESDTDDEIKRIKQNSKIAASAPVDIYEASTDEEDFMKEKMIQCTKEKLFLK